MQFSTLLITIGAAAAVTAKTVPAWMLPQIQNISSLLLAATRKEAEKMQTLLPGNNGYVGTLRNTPIYTDLIEPNQKNSAEAWSKWNAFSKLSKNKIRAALRLPSLAAAQASFGESATKEVDISANLKNQLSSSETEWLDTEHFRNPQLCVRVVEKVTQCALFNDVTTASAAFQSQLSCAQGGISAEMHYTVEEQIISAPDCSAVREVLKANESTLTSKFGSFSPAQAPGNKLQNRLATRGLFKAIAFLMITFPIWFIVTTIAGATLPTFFLFIGTLYLLSE